MYYQLPLKLFTSMWCHVKENKKKKDVKKSKILTFTLLGPTQKNKIFPKAGVQNCTILLTTLVETLPTVAPYMFFGSKSLVHFQSFNFFPLIWSHVNENEKQNSQRKNSYNFETKDGLGDVRN